MLQLGVSTCFDDGQVHVRTVLQAFEMGNEEHNLKFGLDDIKNPGEALKIVLIEVCRRFIEDEEIGHWEARDIEQCHADCNCRQCFLRPAPEFNGPLIIFWVPNMNVELVVIILEEHLKIDHVGENLCNFLVNDWKLLLDDFIADPARMHAAEEQVICGVALAKLIEGAER